MATVNFQVRLQKLLKNELSSSSNDKNQVISGFKSLIDILQIPQINKQIHGYHELLFECISQIILTRFNQFFDDNELRLLLELASNACILSMSQNQIIDGWLQNIEERTFEKPDDYEEEDDDDDEYEDATESEEEEEKITTVQDNKRRSNRGGGHQQKHVLIDNSNSVSSKEKSPPLTQSISNQRYAHVAHSRGERGGHQNSKQSVINESSTHGHNNRGGRGISNTNDLNKRTDNTRGRGCRSAPFDNKYGVDLRLYDCYICGEYGHVQYDCPAKRGNTKFISRGARRGGFTNKNERNESKSSSSDSSIETNLPGIDHTRIQQVYNQSSKLLNSSQSTDERNKTFDLFLSTINTLQKQHGENLSKIFLEKESIFYPLFCHIAQNDFLFTNNQYSKLYHLKNLLLPQKQGSLNEDRSIFCRQRVLLPLNTITEHIHTVAQIQQTIFNDFQEYIIRSTPPISIALYDLIKYFLQSHVHIDTKFFENLTKKNLFDLKKNLFSNEQFNELHLLLDIRTKRAERNNQKQVWKERLNLFKNNQISIDLNPWISEFEQILQTNFTEQRESSPIAVDHAMWYFAVLLMASSGHLNKEQYEHLLKSAVQSPLFNGVQKFHFQFYLDKGQAPITICELNEIKIKLECQNMEEKKSGYEQIHVILDRSKPEFNDQSRKIEDIIPIIDNHVLLRLTSLVEIICSDTKTFSNQQCTELLDKFLQKSTIVRPLSNSDQQRLTSYYSRPISLTQLRTICSSLQPDLNGFLSLLQHETIVNNDEIYDHLTETIVNIFENRRKFSNEKCRELKNLIEKKTFGKKRSQLINESYQKFRFNKKDLPPINPTILNQFLTDILSHDNQAPLEFFALLEEISQIIDFKENSIEFEINRGLLSTIILVIIEADVSKSFTQRLNTIIENQTEFFTILLSEQQYKLLATHLMVASDVDPLIDSIKTKQLKQIAQQSPMLQMATFKQQLESYCKKTSDENNEASAIPKTNDGNDHSTAHREIFRCLESDDASMNALVVQQLHAYLLDEQLSPEILLPKFIQALQMIFKNSKKFPEVSLDEWARLISKNRGKIFSNDVECDRLLLDILFTRVNLPIDTLNSLNRLIQSRKTNERQDGLHKLLLLLKNSQINNENYQINNLPTISNQLYNVIMRVVFDQKFNDNQVRQCLTAAKNSWLLNNDHRQKLNDI